MNEGFRTFDHTGDLGLEVWAPDRERLFELAAEGVMAQVIEVGGSREMRSGDAAGAAAKRATVELDGHDLADLLVAWLNAALLESELARAVWIRARIDSLSATRLRGTLEGPRRDPVRQTFLREVKAVSHHALELGGDACGWRCRVVLDI